MKAEHRIACVEAINAFRQSHGLLPLVVCSRTAEYQALAVKVRLHGAVVVQPLTAQQVESYLTEIGPAGAAVRRAIREDPTLWELLDTPLMLNIITVAYMNHNNSHPLVRGTLNERRDRLFGAYVDQMFRRRGAERHYTPEQTVHWLRWLARQMANHGQTVFYIERLQPDWLSGKKRRAFRLVVGLVGGLVVGLVGGLVIGLVGGVVGGLIGGVVGGRVFGLILGLIGGLIGGVEGLLVGVHSLEGEVIECAETINWSWPKKTTAKNGARTAQNRFVSYC